MKAWWYGAPIRVRLTALYAAVLALLLVVYASATYLAVRKEFREQLEDQADKEAAAALKRIDAKEKKKAAEAKVAGKRAKKKTASTTASQ